MADNKKYYYLKLKDNFYESDAMIILESMPDGYLYSNILMKLYLRSLKDGGKLLFNNMIPYTPPVLAKVVRHQVGTVEKALDIFQELGLIEVLDNGTIFMTDIQNFIGESSTEADRKRQYRNRINEEKTALLGSGGQMSGQMSDKSTPEIEIDIDIDKDIDIKKENYKRKSTRFVPPTLEEIQNYINEKNLNVDAKKFYDYFTVGEWVDSKGNKVKNWKQKLLTWNSSNQNKTRQQSNGLDDFRKIWEEMKNDD